MKDKKIARPYGLWPSPVTASRLPGRSPFGDVRWTSDGGGLVWLQRFRGQGQLVYLPLGGARRELLSDLSAEGGVGYGGGEYCLTETEAIFAEKSGALFRRSLETGLPRQLTPAYGRAASPAVSPDEQRIVFVHSDASQDALAMVDAAGAEWPVKLVSGADFYMQPIWSPDGKHLAWIEWDHPNMPWDATRLRLGTLTADHTRIKNTRIIAGGSQEMVVEPCFSPDGRSLSYIVSRGDWQALDVLNLESGQVQTWFDGDFDLSQPAWEQGQHSYGWSPFGGRIFLLRYKDALAEMWSVNSTGGRQQIPTEPYTWLEQLSISPVADEFALIASSPKISTQIIRWDSHRWRPVAFSSHDEILPEDLPNPQAVTWKSADGHIVHGLFSPPANRQFTGEGAPPIIVHVHGGPTNQSVLEYPREAQYFTSRGYAWLEVNYRGSSGYGRNYVNELHGQWGKLDTQDCVSGAQAMASRSLADPKRMVIMGSSAGGFAVLNALAQYPGVFKAGVALYPVCNLFTLSLETHKFEKHYDESLAGRLPDAAEFYREHSPLFQAEKIKDAVAIFHGSSDTAVPLSQPQAIVERLKASGVPYLYQVYEGEGHGFRQPETLSDMYPRIEQFLLERVIFS